MGAEVDRVSGDAEDVSAGWPERGRAVVPEPPIPKLTRAKPALPPPAAAKPAVLPKPDSWHSAIRPTPPPRSPDADRRRREDANTQALKLAEPAPATPEAEAEAFARFGRFDLLGRIAVGGMAEILLARESIEGAGSRQVVIKAVRGEFAEDGAFANMFMDEGRLAMRLTHPNICTVYECGRHDGRFFIAMEYVRGATLREVLVRATKRGRAMPIPLLVRVIALVAEALDFAHRARDSQGRELSIVHRDVSPHNVMVRYDGVVKLLDFGVAKADNSHHASESGALKGKFSYMSPEQAMGSPIDARSDVFALGVCIFEAVTGRRLFHRKTQYDTLKAILEVDAPPMASFRDDVPEALEAIVRRALEKDPTKRYLRAADLQHDLEALLTEMREVASTARIGAFMDELFGEEARRGPILHVDEELRERYASPLLDTLPPARRTPRVAWALGATLALASAIGVGALLATSPESTPAPPSAASSGAATEASPEPEPPARAPVEPPAREAPLSDTVAGPDPVPAEPLTAEEEPSNPPSKRAVPRERRRVEHPRPRRPRDTVIVTDPGF